MPQQLKLFILAHDLVVRSGIQSQEESPADSADHRCTSQAQMHMGASTLSIAGMHLHFWHEATADAQRKKKHLHPAPFGQAMQLQHPGASHIRPATQGQPQNA